MGGGDGDDGVKGGLLRNPNIERMGSDKSMQVDRGIEDTRTTHPHKHVQVM